MREGYVDCVVKEWWRHQQSAVSSEDEGGRMLSCMEGSIVAGYCVAQTETRYHYVFEREGEWSIGDGAVPISYHVKGVV